MRRKDFLENKSKWRRIMVWDERTETSEDFLKRLKEEMNEHEPQQSTYAWIAPFRKLLLNEALLRYMNTADLDKFYTDVEYAFSLSRPLDSWLEGCGTSRGSKRIEGVSPSESASLSQSSDLINSFAVERRAIGAQGEKGSDRVGGAGELSKDVKHAPRKGKEAQK